MYATAPHREDVSSILELKWMKDTRTSFASLAACNVFKVYGPKVSRRLAAKLQTVAASGGERAVSQRHVERVEPPP